MKKNKYSIIAGLLIILTAATVLHFTTPKECRWGGAEQNTVRCHKLTL